MIGLVIGFRQIATCKPYPTALTYKPISLVTTVSVRWSSPHTATPDTWVAATTAVTTRESLLNILEDGCELGLTTMIFSYYITCRSKYVEASW